MTEARRKAKMAMLFNRITFADLHEATGLAKGSIHNLLSDLSKSSRGRQLLTNALQEDLWPGVSITERRFTFAAETEIEFIDEDVAKEFASEFSDAVRRDANTIKFLIDFKAVLPLHVSTDRSNKIRRVRRHA